MLSDLVTAPRSLAAACLGTLLLAGTTALAPTAAAAPDLATGGCAGFEPSYRTVGVETAVVATQARAQMLAPTSSARGRVVLSRVGTVPSQVRARQATKQDARVIIRAVERSREVDLAPRGTSTDDARRGMRLDLENTTDRNQKWVLYRGTTSYSGRVQRSTCAADGSEVVIGWERAGRLISFVPQSQGAVLCGKRPSSPLAAAAQEIGCP